MLTVTTFFPLIQPTNAVLNLNQFSAAGSIPLRVQVCVCVFLIHQPDEYIFFYFGLKLRPMPVSFSSSTSSSSFPLFIPPLPLHHLVHSFNLFWQGRNCKSEVISAPKCNPPSSSCFSHRRLTPARPRPNLAKGGSWCEYLTQVVFDWCNSNFFFSF